MTKCKAKVKLLMKILEKNNAKGYIFAVTKESFVVSPGDLNGPLLQLTFYAVAMDRTLKIIE